MSFIELRLPDLGLGKQPVTLSGWLVRRGARIAVGEPVAEILAGPATVDLPAPASGILTKRLVEVDERISPHQPLGVIETDADA